MIRILFIYICFSKPEVLLVTVQVNFIHVRTRVVFFFWCRDRVLVIVQCAIV